MRPGQRHLYRVSSVLPATGSSLHPAVCLTCTVATTTTSDDIQGERRIGASGRQNGSTGGRSELHDRYETVAQTSGDREHRPTKDHRKDRSRGRNASSKFPTQYHLPARRSSRLAREELSYLVASHRRASLLCTLLVSIVFSVATSLW